MSAQYLEVATVHGPREEILSLSYDLSKSPSFPKQLSVAAQRTSNNADSTAADAIHPPESVSLITTKLELAYCEEELRRVMASHELIRKRQEARDGLFHLEGRGRETLGRLQETEWDTLLAIAESNALAATMSTRSRERSSQVAEWIQTETSKLLIKPSPSPFSAFRRKQYRVGSASMLNDSSRKFGLARDQISQRPASTGGRPPVALFRSPASVPRQPEFSSTPSATERKTSLGVSTSPKPMIVAGNDIMNKTGDEIEKSDEALGSLPLSSMFANGRPLTPRRPQVGDPRHYAGESDLLSPSELLRNLS